MAADGDRGGVHGVGLALTYNVYASTRRTISPLLTVIFGCGGAALAEAEARLRSPFAWLPGLFDDAAARECERSRVDLARVERGLCTRWPLVDRGCVCGEERYPYGRCGEPNCLYAPGLPDRFDCVGDEIVEGYLGH